MVFRAAEAAADRRSCSARRGTPRASGWPELHEPPRSESGGASFEICPCCGFEFGYDDDDRGLTYEDARVRWINGGLQWWSRARPAQPDWNPAAQLRSAGL